MKVRWRHAVPFAMLAIGYFLGRQSVDEHAARVQSLREPISPVPSFSARGTVTNEVPSQVPRPDPNAEPYEIRVEREGPFVAWYRAYGPEL